MGPAAGGSPSGRGGGAKQRIAKTPAPSEGPPSTPTKNNKIAKKKVNCDKNYEKWEDSTTLLMLLFPYIKKG